MSFFNFNSKAKGLGYLVEYIAGKTEENGWFLLVVIGIMILFLVFIALLASM